MVICTPYYIDFMRVSTIENLKYFIGKICTILVTPINRTFDEATNREHFVVRVRDINDDGIWGTHPFNSEMVSYFTFPHVVSIHEEVVLDPNNPDHARMLKEFEDRYGKKPASDIKSSVTEKPNNTKLPIIEKPAEGCACDAQPDHSNPEKEREGDATFVDIDALSSLAAETKQAYDRLKK